MSTPNPNLQFVYSGGANNSDPSASLGGFPSSTVIASGVLDNLFDDLTNRNITQNIIENKAIYVQNISDSDTSQNTSVWLSPQNTGVSVYQIGIPVENEVQILTIENTNTITGGSFILLFGEQIVPAVYWTSVSGVAMGIQDALLATNLLTDVSVSVHAFSTYAEYTITFAGADGGKLQPLVQCWINALIFSGNPPSFSTTIDTPGSPINDIALDIGFQNNLPYNISFVDTSAENPITVGNLEPGQSFFIWIQRNLLAGADVSETSESITLNVASVE